MSIQFGEKIKVGEVEFVVDESNLELIEMLLVQKIQIDKLSTIAVGKPTAKQAIIAQVVSTLVKDGKQTIEWKDLIDGCKELGYTNKSEILTISSQQKDSCPFYGIMVKFLLPKRSDI